eukprot:1551202-Prorocentrum_lima.AAC.1
MPYKVQLKDWAEDRDEFDLVDLEDELPLKALTSPWQKSDEDRVAAAQEVEDPNKEGPKGRYISQG